MLVVGLDRFDEHGHSQISSTAGASSFAQDLGAIDCQCCPAGGAADRLVLHEGVHVGRGWVRRGAHANYQVEPPGPFTSNQHAPLRWGDLCVTIRRGCLRRKGGPCKERFLMVSR